MRELRAGDVVEIRSSVTALGEKVLAVRQTARHCDAVEMSLQFGATE
jgi:acyl-CoA thioesterase FadM